MRLGFESKRVFHNTTGLGNYSRSYLEMVIAIFPEAEIHLFSPTVVRNSRTAFLFEASNVFIHTNERKIPNALWRSWHMSKLINALQLDYFHGLSHELPIGIGHQTKTLVTFHDLIYETHPKLFPLVDRIGYKIKYRLSARMADKVVCVSEATKQDLQRIYGVSDEKLVVQYQTCAEAYQTAPRTPSAMPTHFLYVGTVNERKNLLTALEAYVGLPSEEQPPFIIVGEGAAYKDKAIAFVREKGLEHKVRFLGFLSVDELIPLYDGALAFVLPSWSEGFGIPIIEALFRGVPVICSNRSALPEAAGDGGILIEPDDVLGIRNAMRSVQRPSVREILIDQGRRHVRANFQTEVIKKGIQRLYSS